jgi:hypothetical protein
MKILSLIPPMTQLNTPYPSTAYLTGFLRSRGFDAVQADLALELVLNLLSESGIDTLHTACVEQLNKLIDGIPSDSIASFMAQFLRYRATIAPTIRFLQNTDSTLSHRIAGRNFLPEGPRFAALDNYTNEGDDEYTDT